MDINLDDYDLLQCDFRPTMLGEAMRIRLHRKDMAPMGWREIFEVINAVYPGRWACQWFPPADRVIDQANKYHLYVFEQAPQNMDIGEPAPRGSIRCAVDYPLREE